MRALTVTAWGSTPAIQDVADPVRESGWTIVRMLAAGVNPVDLAIGSGRFYGQVPDPPFVLGAEVVGEVVESDAMPVGSLVWALVTTGGFAEFCAIPDDHLVPVPEGIDPVTAAAFGIAGLAGWMSVRARGELRHGETVLVLGASGVVGQVAVQTARRCDAGRIVAVSRTREGIRRALDLGADWFVPVSTDGMSDELRAACAPGADLVIDMLWGPPFQAALAAGAPRARFIQVGNAAGATATVPGGSLRGGRFDVRGFSVFTEAHADLAAGYHALLEQVRAGHIALAVEPLPLIEAPVAWMRQQGGAAGRKLVLVNG